MLKYKLIMLKLIIRFIAYTCIIKLFYIRILNIKIIEFKTMDLNIDKIIC